MSHLIIDYFARNTIGKGVKYIVEKRKETIVNMKITQLLLDSLIGQTKASPRLRMNMDLRNSPEISRSAC